MRTAKTVLVVLALFALLVPGVAAAGTISPTSASGSGVTLPNNAIDGDPATAATLTATSNAYGVISVVFPVAVTSVTVDVAPVSGNVNLTYNSTRCSASSITGRRSCTWTFSARTSVTISTSNYSSSASIYEIISDGTAPPAAPTGLTADLSDTGVSLTWAAVSEVTGYKVYRDGVQLADVGMSTSFLDTAASPGNSYTYQVRGYNTAGDGALSSTVTATVPVQLPDPPGTPQNLTASVGVAGAVTLTWSAPSTGGPVDSYQINRDGSQIAEVTETSYVDMAATPSTTHSYTVRAKNGGGSSAESTAATATIPEPAAPPAAPASLTAIPGVEQVTLSWPTTPGATGYRIYRDGVEIGTTAALTYTATDLVGGVSYEFAVAALNAIGESPTVTATATPTEYVPSGNLWRFDFLTGLSASVSQTLVSLAPLFWIVAGLIVATGMVTIGIQWLRRGF